MPVIADNSLRETAAALGVQLRERGLMITAAESCTGGWVCKALTDNAGSSDYISAGLVTYSNQAKVSLLGVSEDALVEFGAVSEPVVREMVAGALSATDADVAVAISGVAGPGGGSENKPVGMVWFAWGDRNGRVEAHCEQFSGDRNAVRSQSVLFVLEAVNEFVRREH